MCQEPHEPFIRLYLDPIDIYYIWASSSSLDRSTDPVKLTTWRPEHAHKLLRVASPPDARNRAAGSGAVTWRLGLFTVSQGTFPSREMMNINLTELNHILPVYSAPILLFSPNPTASHASSKHGKAQPVKIQKQDEIQRLYTVPLLTLEETSIEKGDPRGLITIVEKTSFNLDKVTF